MKIEKLKFYKNLKLILFALFFYVNSYGQNFLDQFYNCSELYDGIWYTQITENKENGEWIMIFEDNFDGNELDNSKWFTCGDGWNCYRGVKELQYYKEANCIVNDGVVKLTAKEDPGNYDTWEFDEEGNGTVVPLPFDYTSGWLQTKMKFEYGFYEIRAKVPKGKSFWPAFWFYGCPIEIDVFEFDGKNTDLLKTNVIDWGNCSNGDNENCNMNNSKTTDFSEDYHKYSLEWDQYKLIFRIDGNIYRTSYKYYDYNGVAVQNKSGLAQGAYQKDKIFPDNPAHLILNFALDRGPIYDLEGNLVQEGSGYGDGPPDEFTVFPSSFDIDYVRVWKYTNDDKDFSICDLNLGDSPTEIPAIVTGKKITLGGLNCITNVLDDERLELIATEEIIIKPEFKSFIGSDFTARIHTGQKNNFYPSDDIQQITEVDKAIIEFELSPNPVKDFLNIEFNGYLESLEIIDLNGRIIQKHKKPNQSFTIDFSRELQGIYFVNLKTNNETITKKIIKL